MCAVAWLGLSKSQSVAEQSPLSFRFNVNEDIDLGSAKKKKKWASRTSSRKVISSTTL
jgi:hypothetical protein